MQFTVQEIAARLGGTVEGNPSVAVKNFAKIEEATQGDLTFLANPKYTHHIYTTGASAVLVSREFVPEQPVAATLIRVANPYEALAALTTLAAEMLKPNPGGIEQPSYIAPGVEVPEDAYIGAFAYIAPGVKLGKNVKIYPHAYIGHGSTVGDDTIIYSGAKIYYGCHIGRRCTIHSGAVVGADGFGFAPDNTGKYHKIEQLGAVRLGDDVEIGANTCVDRATMGDTIVGNGAKIDNLVQVAHNVTVGESTVVAAQAGFAGSSHIGARCMIGGQVGVAGHISVGDGTQIGAQSGIPNNVKPGSRLMGYPAVPAVQFARTTAMLKRLPHMSAQLESILKSLDNETK